MIVSRVVCEHQILQAGGVLATVYDSTTVICLIFTRSLSTRAVYKQQAIIIDGGEDLTLLLILAGVHFYVILLLFFVT